MIRPGMEYNNGKSLMAGPMGGRSSGVPGSRSMLQQQLMDMGTCVPPRCWTERLVPFRFFSSAVQMFFHVTSHCTVHKHTNNVDQGGDGQDVTADWWTAVCGDQSEDGPVPAQFTQNLNGGGTIKEKKLRVLKTKTSRAVLSRAGFMWWKSPKSGYDLRVTRVWSALRGLWRPGYGDESVQPAGTQPVPLLA